VSHGRVGECSGDQEVEAGKSWGRKTACTTTVGVANTVPTMDSSQSTAKLVEHLRQENSRLCKNGELYEKVGFRPAVLEDD